MRQILPKILNCHIVFKFDSDEVGHPIQESDFFSQNFNFSEFLKLWPSCTKAHCSSEFSVDGRLYGLTSLDRQATLPGRQLWSSQVFGSNEIGHDVDQPSIHVQIFKEVYSGKLFRQVLSLSSIKTTSVDKPLAHQNYPYYLVPSRYICILLWSVNWLVSWMLFHYRKLRFLVTSAVAIWKLGFLLTLGFTLLWWIQKVKANLSLVRWASGVWQESVNLIWIFPCAFAN